MAEKGPPAPTPKPVRVKPATQTKTKEPPQKKPTKTKSFKDYPSIGTKSGNRTFNTYRSARRSSPSLSTISTKPTA